MKCIKEVLRLYKAYPICDEQIDSAVSDAETIKHGFIVTDEVKQYGPGVSEHIHTICDMYGYDIASLNNGFYKSFSAVREAADIQLYFDQILHYLTTYTAESLGAYDKDNVYIPAAALDLPEGNALEITVIKGITFYDIKARTIRLITKGVALSQQTVDDVIAIIKALPIDDIDVDLVANREVKTALYKLYGVVPEQPVEFLRYLVYEATGETLLIKNDELIQSIKEADPHTVRALFDRYMTLCGLRPLATVFHRFKPMWLAFKLDKKTSWYVNKLRKLADTYHRPLKQSLMDSITSLDCPDMDRLREELRGASIFKKAQVANSLAYRMSEPTSIMYKVRNGKAFAEAYRGNGKPTYADAYAMIVASIAEDVAKKAGGRKVFIPSNVKYAFPTSEKMFFGNIPYGTSVGLGKTAVAGVHWEDKGDARIDLDLHLQNTRINMGWDARYRAEDVLYSGDMTAAPQPKGATEVFYFGQDFASSAMMIVLNHFNFSESTKGVPYSFILDAAQDDRIDKKHLIDHATLATNIKCNIDRSNEVAGLITSDELSEKRFFFLNFAVGKGISTSINDVTNNAFQYLYDSTQTQLMLNDILEKAGVVFTSKEDCEIDLSLGDIDKTILLDLIA